MNKPVIGVVPLWDEGRNSIWMAPGYMNGIEAAGGLPVILPLTDDAATIMDVAARFAGFLLTGGHDVSPALYGEAVSPRCGETCPRRDRMETILLNEALRLDKPVLGICRGLQFINAALGGTLWQDLPSQHPSTITHAQKPPYDTPAHEVALTDELATLLDATALSVNSYHHQGIRTLSPRLAACAQAPDGLIEAARIPGQRFAWAVQWHPELALAAPHNQRLFAAFVAASL